MPEEQVSTWNYYEAVKADRDRWKKLATRLVISLYSRRHFGGVLSDYELGALAEYEAAMMEEVT